MRYLLFVPAVGIGLYILLLYVDSVQRNNDITQARDFVLALNSDELKELSDACVRVLVSNADKDRMLAPRDKAWNSLPSVLLKLKPRYIAFSKNEMFVILGERGGRNLTLICSREGVVEIHDDEMEGAFKYLYPERLGSGAP